MLKAKNINKQFDDDGHDDDDEMKDAFAWACHHMCFSLCQWMNALLRQGCHQKQKYIIANIVSSVEWKTRKQLYEPCSSCTTY